MIIQRGPTFSVVGNFGNVPCQKERLFSSLSKLTISLVDQKAYDNKMEMNILFKWNGKFRSNQSEKWQKWITSNDRSLVPKLNRRVKPKISVNWKGAPAWSLVLRHSTENRSMGLFTWKEDDPSTMKVLKSGSS